MKKIDYNNGPFGNYERGTTGHVINAMAHWGILIIVNLLDRKKK